MSDGKAILVVVGIGLILLAPTTFKTTQSMIIAGIQALIGAYLIARET